ncbi:rRNA maturation RNase YbeY [bacterium]|nr:rRNA maturation RNase YbeY [bacterium]
MIEVSNLTNQKVEKEFLKKIANKILESEKKENFDLSVFLVGPSRIRNLNKKYRGKNRITDILSFGQTQNLKFIMPPNKKEELGEIIVCPRVVKKNAKRYGVSFKEELARVLIHGILHLLGYNHEKSEKAAKKMREKEEYYLAQILNSTLNN